MDILRVSSRTTRVKYVNSKCSSLNKDDFTTQSIRQYVGRRCFYLDLKKAIQLFFRSTRSRFKYVRYPSIK